MREWDAYNWIEDDSWYYEPCLHPEHNPPMHIWIPPGKRMVHICPSCGKKTTISGGPRCYW